jgi:hypothetical protein
MIINKLNRKAKLSVGASLSENALLHLGPECFGRYETQKELKIPS